LDLSFKTNINKWTGCDEKLPIFGMNKLLYWDNEDRRTLRHVKRISQMSWSRSMIHKQPIHLMPALFKQMVESIVAGALCLQKYFEAFNEGIF
jgi:hypothetical protein